MRKLTDESCHHFLSALIDRWGTLHVKGLGIDETVKGETVKELRIGVYWTKQNKGERILDIFRHANIQGRFQTLILLRNYPVWCLLSICAIFQISLVKLHYGDAILGTRVHLNLPVSVNSVNFKSKPMNLQSRNFIGIIIHKGLPLIPHSALIHQIQGTTHGFSGNEKNLHTFKIAPPFTLHLFFCRRFLQGEQRTEKTKALFCTKRKGKNLHICTKKKHYSVQSD